MTPAEHYAEAERLIAEAERMANDAVDLIANGARGAAQGKFDAFDNIMAMATTHALLANTPTPLEPVTGSVGHATLTPETRVVLVVLDSRGALARPDFGTVLAVGDLTARGQRALVDWDDQAAPTEHDVAELRVVLGV